MERKLRRCYWLLFFLLLSAIAWEGKNVWNMQKKTDFVSADSRAVAGRKDGGEMVYASGHPVGIYIKTEGVLVLGTQPVKAGHGKEESPAKNKLKSGDYILAVDETPVNAKKQFLSLVQKKEGEEMTLTILRGGERQKIKIKPAYSEENQCYQIGAWIRNDTQGIGTVTYVKENGEFAALGHGINDCDLGVHMMISGGSIYQTDIASIMKGEKKNPGEIIGTIDYTRENYLGDIGKNTICGVFGNLEKRREEYLHGEQMEVAKGKEIKTGNAWLRTSISGESKDYAIEIEKICLNKKEPQKALKIKVTDPSLIALTGGIIQGLSGSPIIQNNRLVGAVTHVFVDSPIMGYGICAETMMEESQG
ncbi:MAG: SpoIVB peptidase [Eubacteriales bacterium]|nr:SpoIVB peptidase [Eubacteriales bacterium]